VRDSDALTIPTMTQTIVRAVKAHVGETVLIRWRNAESEILEEEHTAPPADVWKARLTTPATEEDR